MKTKNKLDRTKCAILTLKVGYNYFQQIKKKDSIFYLFIVQILYKLKYMYINKYDDNG